MTVGNQSGVPWRVIDDVGPLAAATQRAHHVVPAGARADFARLGVCSLPGVFREWVEPLRAGLERQLDRPGDYAFPCDSTSDDEPGRFFDSYCNWQRTPEFLSYVLASSAASIAAQCMGSTTAQFFHEHVFSKEGGTTKATPWHHDLPYYCVDGNQTASVYVALDDMPIETGVRFAAGSHRDGQLYFPRNFSAGTDYESADSSMRSAPRRVEAADVVVHPLVAGDALVFDFRTLHGTTNAEITDRRRAFSTRWLGDDVVHIERPGETSPPLTDLGLVAGERMRADWFPILWPNQP